MLRDVILGNRSCRRFDQEHAISLDTLRELVDLARLSASGSNKQPLKYYLSCDPETNEKIFPLVSSWKGAIPEWPGPKDGEKPSAYIIILGDTEVSSSFGIDTGIAAQSILLGATEKGLGGCMLGSIKKEETAKVLDIPPRLEVVLAIALGKPGEKIVLETLEQGQDFKYWLDKNDVHHVPKRKLEDIIVS